MRVNRFVFLNLPILSLGDHLGVMAQPGRALLRRDHRKAHRLDVFHSIFDLQMTINNYLHQHNADPKPFVWTASASSIIEMVNRGKQAFESLH